MIFAPGRPLDPKIDNSVPSDSHRWSWPRLAAWIRGHWSIENKLHWVHDVTYDEDRS